MDFSDISWLAEMGLDNSMFDFLDKEMAVVIGQDLDNSSSSSTLLNSMPTEPPPPPNNFSNFSTILQPNQSPVILNFGNNVDTVSPLFPEQDQDQNQTKLSQPVKKPSRARPRSQTYDHIIAERKRREQLSQRFIALSTIVPGLKKTDKTSVLGDAIKYMKHLQERVKTLEEQVTRETVESVVLVKKSQVMEEDEGSSSDKSGCSDEQSLPEIEARVCRNHILLRIQCERRRGVLVNLLSHVEAMNLAVVNINVTPFGSFALDITIIAEMENDFNLTVKEVVKRLRAAL